MGKKKDKKLKKEKKGASKKEKALKKSEAAKTVKPEKSAAEKVAKKTVKKPIPAQESQENSFSFGGFVKAARLERKMTQDELAKLCGTNKSYISRIENETTDMRVSTLQKIVEALNGVLKIEL